VTLQWTSSADIDFAISRGYPRAKAAQPPAPPAGGRLGQRLLKQGLIGQEDLVRALRQQKRSNQKLGEVLVDMKLITPENLSEELDKS
jgi:hypothetical protein